jgi:hypothetical protein
MENGSGCLNTGQQSFGQYQQQFRDVGADLDGDSIVGNDTDETNIMK